MYKEKIFKLQFKDCKFKHLEKNVTECVIKFDFNIEFFENEFGFPSPRVRKAIKGLGLTFDTNDSGHVIVKGYSKCCGGDRYDRSIGERIAESKAKRNAYRVGLRVGKILEKEARRELVDIMRFNEQMMKCELCEAEHTEYIERDLD